MYKKIIILLIPLTFLILCIGTSIGSSDTSLIHIASIIGYKVLGIPLLKEINPNDVAIIWNLRLPRVFFSLSCR